LPFSLSLSCSRKREEKGWSGKMDRKKAKWGAESIKTETYRLPSL